MTRCSCLRKKKLTLGYLRLLQFPIQGKNISETIAEDMLFFFLKIPIGNV